MKYDISNIKRTKNIGNEVKIPAPHALTETEKQLNLYINKMIEQIIKRYRNQILSGMTKKQQSSFQDSHIYFYDEGFYNKFSKQSKNIEKAVTEQYPYSRIKKDITPFFSKVYNYTRDAFYSRIGNSLGVDMNKIIKTDGLNSFLIQNIKTTTSKIKDASEEVISDLSEKLLIDMRNGKSLEDLTRTAQNILNTSYDRAKTIANNELNQFSANVNKKRAISLGISKAIWRTQSSKVRASHQQLAGKEYVIGKGLKNPNYGKVQSASEFIEPTEEINCRCYAEFIID